MTTIEKNIPIPKRVRNRVYPFHLMEVGDSFFKEIESNKNIYAEKQKIYLAIWRNSQRNTEKKFTTASVENGIRIWRTE